jgi:hypothetical protein
MQTRKIAMLAGVLALALPCATLVACHGKSANSADKVSREMPEGAEWKGVYYSQVYGNLHLINADSGELKGAWRTTAGEAWGELHGKAEGSILKYEWIEHKIGMVGPSATRSGHGYFVYTRPKGGGQKDPDEIHGQWGLGDNSNGNKWDAIKQTNLEPDPKSVMPDEVERGPAITGGDWDGESGAGEGEKKKDSDD